GLRVRPLEEKPTGPRVVPANRALPLYGCEVARAVRGGDSRRQRESALPGRDVEGAQRAALAGRTYEEQARAGSLCARRPTRDWRTAAAVTGLGARNGGERSEGEGQGEAAHRKLLSVGSLRGTGEISLEVRGVRAG